MRNRNALALALTPVVTFGTVALLSLVDLLAPPTAADPALLTLLLAGLLGALAIPTAEDGDDDRRLMTDGGDPSLREGKSHDDADLLATCPECGRTVNVDVNDSCPDIDCDHEFPDREIRCDGGRQPTVEFREMTCVSCDVIDEHRVEKFHDDGYARIQCGVCQFDRKESLGALEGEIATDGGFEHTERTATFSCDDCDDFELEKRYSGMAGTPGEEEYDRIQAPETCPACGGPVTRDDVATDGGQTTLPVGETRPPTVLENVRTHSMGSIVSMVMCAHRFDPEDLRGWLTHEPEAVTRGWAQENAEATVARLLGDDAQDHSTRSPAWNPEEELERIREQAHDDEPEQATLMTDGGERIEDSRSSPEVPSDVGPIDWYCPDCGEHHCTHTGAAPSMDCLTCRSETDWQREPPATDPVRADGGQPTVTVKWWAMGGLRTGEVGLEDIESVTPSPNAGGKNPFEIRLDSGTVPQYCFTIEWPENTTVPKTETNPEDPQ